jgi:alpha-glucosidase
MTYYGTDLKGANLPFNFQLLQCAWSATAVAMAILEYDAALPTGAWPNWVLGNHDQPRIASRIGALQARVAAMLLLTLPGTLTLYYGEEIGMTNVPIAPEEVQDPAEKNEPGIGMGRDPERTPMPWDAASLAGFTTGKPWLPLGTDHASVNVARLNQDEGSILHLYRKLILLRRAHSVLVVGKTSSIAAENNLLRYERAGSAERFLILLNMGHNPIQAVAKTGAICMSTCLDREGDTVSGAVRLRASEGIIIRLAALL